jgi:hypothetical protein
MRTYRLFATFTLTALLSVAAAPGADPRLMNLVMPDSTTLVGANVANAKNTPFGQYILTQMTATMNQNLQSFVTATGFDPRQDVSEILGASTGSAANPSGLVVAIGNFPVSQLTAAIAAKAPQLTVQTYNGATLITSAATPATATTPAQPAYSVAFLSGTIAAVGDSVSVKAAVDRSSGVNSISPALATQVQSLSTTEDAWIATVSPFASLLAGLTGGPTTGAAAGPAGAAGGLGQIGQMFNGIQSSSGGVKFGSTVLITGQALTTDAATAKSIADLMTALVSIAAMSGGQTGAGANSQMASLAQLLQNMKVTSDGPTVNLTMSVPEAQLENVINSLKAPAPAPAIKRTVKPAIIKGE